MLKDYDGLTPEAALEKLKGKSIHDEEDRAFAAARRADLTDEEFEAITEERKPKAVAADAPEAPEAASDAAGATDEAPAVAEGDVDPSKHKLDDLQAMAAEAGLDTSGTKAELAARINEARAKA